MIELKDMQEIVDAIEDRLDQPVNAGYPLRDKEIVGVWRKRCVQALHHLAERNLLTAKDFRGRPFYQHLLQIADEPIYHNFEDAPGRTILLGELIRNIAAPGRITQGLKGTCAATCVEIYLAERDPVEYARLMAGLMTPEGKVQLRNNEMLSRDEEVLAPDEYEFRRSPVSRIFQVACMEYAYPELDYRNDVDGQFQGTDNTGTGLSLKAFDRLLGAISGETWKTISDGFAQFAKLLGLDSAKIPNLHRDGMAIIERSTHAGEPVFATIELSNVRSPIRRAASNGSAEHAAHKVRVLAVDRDKGTVLYDDPMDPQQSWFEGVKSDIVDKYGHCTMPIEDFNKLMVELSYKPQFGPGQQATSAPAATPQVEQTV
ncbi:MAG TPA: hypothetical protein PK156_15595 [Polyangium sp.]|nr:hypothetical protein [Polyangium sp.]